MPNAVSQKFIPFLVGKILIQILWSVVFPCQLTLIRDTALNAERLAIIKDSIDRMRTFVDQVYLPDLLAIAPYYLEYAGIGEGLGNS